MSSATKKSTHNALVTALKEALGKRHVLTSARHTHFYSTGFRIGGGPVCAVALPQSLQQMWQTLLICVKHDAIMLMQAANTGLNGGSTPYGNDYDRPIIIINTLNIQQCYTINQGQQIIALAGSTLYQLERTLKPLQRSPHSVIGSSCIGASVIGGICNNSGGNLVNRGPAYTELALYAQLTANGELELVNHLGIDLGTTAEEILENLEHGNFAKDNLPDNHKLASDHQYQSRVRDIHASTPARFNADARRLHEASGCAGKLAVFAVRLDTFAAPRREQVFYIGSNDPEELTAIRKHILSKFTELPEMGEYMHRNYFNAAEKYAKDTFLFIRYLGTTFLPKLFSLKSLLNGYFDKLPFLPGGLIDRLLHLLAKLWPDHLPRRMRDYRDRFEHHLIIKSNDAVIEETRTFLTDFFSMQRSGNFFACNEKEAQAALLHRFVAANSFTRYLLLHTEQVGGILPLDISLPRNDDNWHTLFAAKDISDQTILPLKLSHFFCMVFHCDFILKKGVDIEAFKQRLFRELDERGAKYPAEHNVGHFYDAEQGLKDFYQSLDPTNSMNAGVGRMSKRKFYA